MRADTFEFLGVSNMVRPDGTQIFNPEDMGKLRKIVKRTTKTCPECGETGWIDDKGEAVCGDDACAVVIDSENEPMVYPEDGFGNAKTMGSNGNSGQANGDPHFRTPALNPAGPAGDSGL